MGIGGIGVSGLAMLLAADGNRVTGCDISVSPQIGKWLNRAGVKFSIGHSKAHLRGADVVIATPAIPRDNPELTEAEKRGIAITARGEALAEYANARCTVAVCGTHGKTTTSCFTAILLRSLHTRAVSRLAATSSRGCGLPQQGGGEGASPGWCIGGWTRRLGCVASAPAPGAPFVIEADESDGTLALYRPAVTVVTSIEQDHLEHFASFDALVDCFRKACAATSGKIVYCADDPVCREVASGRDAIGYGFSPDAALRAEITSADASGQTFDLFFGGKRYGGLRLGVPGRHNVLNALGAIGAALALGNGIDDILPHLGVLDQLPARRFETICCRAGFEVVADYSHHPTEIRALLEMAKTHGKPIFAIFQPHRYSRTKALLEEFPAAFAPLSAASGAAPDRLVLLPVYAAFEEPLEGGTTIDLYAKLRERHDAEGIGVVPELASSVDEIFDYLARSRSIFDKYRVLIVGAGDVIALADRLKKARSVRDIVPKPFGVSFGVPAFADEVADIASEEELASLLASGADIRILGQGTNIVPPPLGVRGTVVRLRCAGLSVRDLPDGTALVSAECGIPGARLLAEMTRRGLSGMEFMAGIPGTLGGWLAMNAGTRFGEIGDAVKTVVAFRRNGKRIEAHRSSCGFAYRHCAFLADKIAFSATLRLRRDAPDAILSRMREALEKRFDFGGLRTAGSAFANPPGGFAGALLEKAGCKGLRIGGAHVLERHANIVAADAGATSSDVLALLETMRNRVLRQSGIELEREIRKW